MVVERLIGPVANALASVPSKYAKSAGFWIDAESDSTVFAIGGMRFVVAQTWSATLVPALTASGLPVGNVHVTIEFAVSTIRTAEPAIYCVTSLPAGSRNATLSRNGAPPAVAPLPLKVSRITFGWIVPTDLDYPCS
jgi:hypothetical protein